MNEISIIIKDSERRYKRDFTEYDNFQVHEDDPVVKECIETALQEFKGEPDSIVLKVHREIK